MSMYLIAFGFNKMGVKWWLFCVLCQIIITTSFGTIKLPSADVEPLPLPKTPSPENISPKLSSPINPKLRKALLEYFKIKYLGNSQSSDVEDSSSSAVVSSSSRVLPIPMIETQTVDDLVNVVQQNSGVLPISSGTSNVVPNANMLTETLISLGNKAKLKTVPMVPNVYERVAPGGVSLPTISSLPVISLESLKRSIESIASTPYSSNLNPPSANKMLFGSYSTSYPLYTVPYPLCYNRVSLPDVVTPSDLMISVNNLDNLRSTAPHTVKVINNYPNAYLPNSSQGFYALNLAPQLSAPNNGNSPLFLTQRAPKVPYLLSTSLERCLDRQNYNYFNQQICPRKIDSMYYQDYINTLVPLPYLRNYGPYYLPSSFNSESQYYATIPAYGILRTLPEPIIPKVNKYDFKMDYETLPLSVNGMKENIANVNEVCLDDSPPTIDIIIDTTIHCDIPENIEDLIAGKISNLDLSDLTKESTVTIQVKPNEAISSLASIDVPNSKSKENIETPVSYNCPPKLPLSVLPTTYINTSPSYTLSQTSANAVSSLNQVVSSITRTILDSFTACLTCAQSKVCNAPCPIPNTTPSLGLPQYVHTCVPQYVHTTTFSPLSTYSTNTLLPSEPLFYDDISPAATNTYLNDAASSISETSTPLKVTLLPPTSFLDYSSSQPCPSTLPLPTLPSYIDIPLTYTPIPQVYNVKSLDRRSKLVEKLLDMVFLAELLHGEGYIDWDALDTVLSILYTG